MTMDLAERGQCRSCKKVVLWARTCKNKLMPVDPGEIEGNANLVLYRDLFQQLCVPGGQAR